MSDHDPRETPPVVAAPVRGQMDLLKPEPAGATWRGRPLLFWGLLALSVVLLVLGGAAGYLAWTNKSRADDWHAQAVKLQADSNRLQAALDQRTKTLNERTEDVNTLAAKVADADEAIQRSEGDVKRLERRQRQLAAEKANVEDARAALALQAVALEDVASAYITCKQGLTQALGYIAANDYYGLSAIANGVDADCAAADNALRSYTNSYE